MENISYYCKILCIMVHFTIAKRYDGWCLNTKGSHQNHGQVLISGRFAKGDCLKACQKINLKPTGCEHDAQEGGECAYHTKPLSKGNGHPKHTCWVFKKGRYS